MKTEVLLNEHKEDLFKLAEHGCSDEVVRDYCRDNNVPYRAARAFVDETFLYLMTNILHNN